MLNIIIMRGLFTKFDKDTKMGVVVLLKQWKKM